MTMRTIELPMRMALSDPVTALARCWKLTRRDGMIMGFTDHDRDIQFGNVTYAALTGVEGTQIESDFGFAVGGGEIAGALASEGLAIPDLAKGLWDGAKVEIFLLDWQNPDNVLLLDQGILGEIRRKGKAFTAELRGLAHRMDEERGRVYTAHCSAAFGDSSCGINVTLSQWSLHSSVTQLEGLHIVHAVQSSHADGIFSSGRLQWLSGSNAGMTMDVCRHERMDGGMRLTLWTQTPYPIQIGDQFNLIAGCDKQWSTCRTRFVNSANFRGFPHMPGNDYLVQIAREGEGAMDGGSLFQ